MLVRRLMCLVVILLLVFALACQAETPTTAEPQTTAAALEEQNAEEVPAETTEPAPEPEEDGEFSISSAGITDGVMDDAYGMRGTQTMEVTLYGSSSKISVPSRSIPIAVQNPPKQAVCLALTMIDPDGNDWVHWLAVNIPVGDLKENASIDQADEFVQGTNSFGFIGYGGPTPPTGVHTYVTTVYALSGPVDLEDGFLEEELMAAIEGLVIDSCVLEGDYAS